MNARRKLAAVGLAAAAVTAAGVTAAQPAAASAYGCTGYGTGVSWQGAYVRNGTWCGGVNGSSTYVNYISGNFYTHLVGRDAVCNRNMKADFYDANGNWYSWAQSGTQWGCSYASDLPSIGIYSWMRSGYVRITLQSNGGAVAAVTESIF